MRKRIALALVLTGLFAGATGCKQRVDRTAFKSGGFYKRGCQEKTLHPICRGKVFF